MNSQKRNTRNLNLLEENSSRFIFGNYSGLLLKGSFNSVLPRLLFFPPLCTLPSARRKGSPSSSWRWRRRFYRRPVDVCHIIWFATTGWALYDMHRAACVSVETCLKTCLELLKNLPTWFSYITIWWNQFEGSWRFDAHQWNSSTTRESSSAIILKSRFFSTGHSACTSEDPDIFWSSDLCTQW